MKLRIDGVEYPMPRMDEMDLAEARIIKRYSGLTLDKIEKAADGDQDLMAAFVHIAFRRQARQLSFEELEERVGRVKLVSIDTTREPGDPVEDDAGPPTLNGKPSSTGPSGGLSRNGTDGFPVTSPVSTGTQL